MKIIGSPRMGKSKGRTRPASSSAAKTTNGVRTRSQFMRSGGWGRRSMTFSSTGAPPLPASQNMENRAPEIESTARGPLKPI